MRTRVGTAAVAMLLLAGCSSAVTGSGSVSASSSVRPPCSGGSSSASPAAPGCIPSPSPSPSPTDTGQAARWAPYTRSVFTTKLGDPGLLNVCAVARGTTLPGGLGFRQPGSTLAAACTLDITGPGVPTAAPTLVVSVLRDDTTTPVRGAKATTVLGQRVLADPYDADRDSCGRTLVLAQPDVTTTVRTSTYGTIPGGARGVCGVGDAVIRSVAAIASGSEQVPVLPTAQPSLLSLDACTVATAAKFDSLPLLAGADTPRPTNFDTSCAFTDSSGSELSTLYVSAGVLRSSADVPDGPPVTVDGHLLYDTATLDSVCEYTSKQAEGETVEAYYSVGGGDPSAGTCRQVASALGRYLDVLGLS